MSMNINENNNPVVLISKSQDEFKRSIVPEFAISFEEAKERLKLLQQFVKEIMIPNVDYGIIEGCKKPSLLKSGAEKLCDVYGFSKRIEVINRLEDWKNGIFHYEIKAILINKRTGQIEAEGVGCCNSKEKKYLKYDGYSIANTILKMAKKRAFIDAVLSATRSSDLFTQDVEDIIYGNKNEPTVQMASKEQLNKLYAVVNSKRINKEAIKSLLYARYNVYKSNQLTMKNIEDFVNYLENNSDK